MGGSTRPQPPTSNSSQVISMFVRYFLKKTIVSQFFFRGVPSYIPLPAGPSAGRTWVEVCAGCTGCAGCACSPRHQPHAEPGPLELCKSMVNPPYKKNKKMVSGSCFKIEGTITNFGDVMIFWGIQKPQWLGIPITPLLCGTGLETILSSGSCLVKSWMLPSCKRT